VVRALKLPSFQFYPGDWMKDPNLRRCSRAARGMWVDILCLMFECEDRGVLSTGGEPWSDEDIAAAVGGDIAEGLSCISELLRKGVAHRNQSGAIFSRRMARDEQIRQERTKAGKQGGSKTQAKLKQSSKQNRTPSSSSSDSVSKETGARAPNIFDVGVPLLTHGGVMTDKNARSLLAKLSQDFGNTKVAAAIAVTSMQPRANPHEYLVGVLKHDGPPARTQAELNRGGGGPVL
jgi:hypothetical protein